MAESCETDCPIFALVRGHIACSPTIRRIIEQRTLKAMDDHPKESVVAGLGSITANAIEQVEHNIEAVKKRLGEVSDECIGGRIANVGGRLALSCGGFNADDLKAILDTQNEMVTRLESSENPNV